MKKIIYLILALVAVPSISNAGFLEDIAGEVIKGAINEATGTGDLVRKMNGYTEYFNTNQATLTSKDQKMKSFAKDNKIKLWDSRCESFKKISAKDSNDYCGFVANKGSVLIENSEKGMALQSSYHSAISTANSEIKKCGNSISCRNDAGTKNFSILESEKIAMESYLKGEPTFYADANVVIAEEKVLRDKTEVKVSEKRKAAAKVAAAKKAEATKVAAAKQVEKDAEQRKANAKKYSEMGVNSPKEEKVFDNLSAIYNFYQLSSFYEAKYSTNINQMCGSKTKKSRLKKEIKSFEVKALRYVPNLNKDLAWKKAGDEINEDDSLDMLRSMPDGSIDNYQAVSGCKKLYLNISMIISATEKHMDKEYGVVESQSVVDKDF